MKRLLLAILIISSAMVACTSTESKPQSYHEERWSPAKNDSVVYVSYANESGQTSNFFMNYLLFRTLFSSGGYPAVYNHYISNPGTSLSSNNYSGYSPKPSTVQHSSTSGTNRSYSSPSRSVGTGSRGYSSPSRSYTSPSPSRSYSSPSRSYSSPSRSYSSPSRSYSSPSRSYSSPSRSH